MTPNWQVVVVSPRTFPIHEELRSFPFKMPMIAYVTSQF
jgi:hypothetical protein